MAATSPRAYTGPMDNKVFHMRAQAMLALVFTECRRRVSEVLRKAPGDEVQAAVEYFDNPGGREAVGALAGRTAVHLMHLMGITPTEPCSDQSRPPGGYIVVERADGHYWGMEGDRELMKAADRTEAVAQCWAHAILHRDPPGFSVRGSEVRQWQDSYVGRLYASCADEVSARRLAWRAWTRRTQEGMPQPGALGWSDEEVEEFEAHEADLARELDARTEAVLSQTMADPSIIADTENGPEEAAVVSTAEEYKARFGVDQEAAPQHMDPETRAAVCNETEAEICRTLPRTVNASEVKPGSVVKFGAAVVVRLLDGRHYGCFGTGYHPAIASPWWLAAADVELLAENLTESQIAEVAGLFPADAERWCEGFRGAKAG